MLYLTSPTQKKVFLRDLSSGPCAHERVVRTTQKIWSPIDPSVDPLGCARHVLTHFILTVTQRGRDSSCSHFPDEETEVQRGEVPSPWSLRRWDVNTCRASALRI